MGPIDVLDEATDEWDTGFDGRVVRVEPSRGHRVKAKPKSGSKRRAKARAAAAEAAAAGLM